MVVGNENSIKSQYNIKCSSFIPLSIIPFQHNLQVQLCKCLILAQILKFSNAGNRNALAFTTVNEQPFLITVKSVSSDMLPHQPSFPKSDPTLMLWGNHCDHLHGCLAISELCTSF